MGELSSARVLVQPRPVALAGGVMGVEAVLHDDWLSLRFRLVAAPLADGRTAVLDFRGVRELESDPDVDDMIARFEPHTQVGP
jgi:hypothetical protein